MNRRSITDLPVGRRLVLAGIALSPAALWLLDGADDGGTAHAAGTGFVHPGLLHTEADFTRMRAKVSAGKQPWAAAWTALTSHGRSRLGQTPSAVATITRDPAGRNDSILLTDIRSMYQLALRWKISGDTRYADLAVTFLNAWSSTLTTINGGERALIAGFSGWQLANAAEIMRTYPGWAATDVRRLQTLMADLWPPICTDFLANHNGSVITHFWPSWDAPQLATLVAVGIFADRKDIFDTAMEYYLRSGRGNGAAAQLVYRTHPGHLGQYQESVRDQGHSTLIGQFAVMSEMAWNQGVDLWGYRSNRLLSALEYVAASNVPAADGTPRYLASLPFTPMTNNQGTFTSVSMSGAPHGRRIWQVVQGHYVGRKGLSAPYVRAIANALGPEHDVGAGDDLGWGSLTFARDLPTRLVPPSSVWARIVGGNVVLSWWGSNRATSYRVRHARSASGPFTTIATVKNPRTFTHAAPVGDHWYRIVAVAADGSTSKSAVVQVHRGSKLRLRLPLSSTTGHLDTTSGGRDGVLRGGATWGAGRVAGTKSLSLSGGGYLELPKGVVDGLGDFSLAVWVNCSRLAPNMRIFDFGWNDARYMTLVAKDGSGHLRFSVTGQSRWGEAGQTAAAPGALPTGRWVHLAVTLLGRTAKVYVNGAVAATCRTVDLPPFQLGPTRRNWLGRSQYAADPTFEGRMQDLRIWSGCLSAATVKRLASG